MKELFRDILLALVVAGLPIAIWFALTILISYIGVV